MRFERLEGVCVCVRNCGALFRFWWLVVLEVSAKRGVLMPELLSKVVPSVRLKACSSTIPS